MASPIDLDNLIATRFPATIEVADLKAVLGADTKVVNNNVTKAYLGFVAPAGDGTLMRSILEAAPSLTLFAADTDERQYGTVGSSPTTASEARRNAVLGSLTSRVQVLMCRNAITAMRRIGGRKLHLVLINDEDEATEDVLALASSMLAEGGILAWRCGNVWTG